MHIVIIFNFFINADLVINKLLDIELIATKIKVTSTFIFALPLSLLNPIVSQKCQFSGWVELLQFPYKISVLPLEIGDLCVYVIDHSFWIAWYFQLLLKEYE